MSSSAPDRSQAQAGSLPFEFRIDATRKLLAVTKRGYWDMAMLNAFADALRLNLRRMSAQGGCRYYLVDASEYAVQSAEIAAALQRIVTALPADCPERMAGIMGSKLSALQARHAGDAPNRRVFSTRQEAEAWLFSQ